MCANEHAVHPGAEEYLLMGKYVLGLLLGVPVIVLVVIYLLFN